MTPEARVGGCQGNSSGGSGSAFPQRNSAVHIQLLRTGMFVELPLFP